MNRWLARKGLKLTSKGERVFVSAAAVTVVGMAGLAFWLEGIVNSANGVVI